MADQRFVGAWELQGTEIRDREGKVIGQSLPGWTGQIMYSADGHMSAQLMGPERPVFASADRLQAPPEQRQQAFDTYVAYFGTYSVDDGAGVVTHHVRGSSSPPMVGTDQPRHFELTGHQLVLSPPPRQEGERTYLTWKRVAP